MLTLQQIKEDPERVIARLAVKGFDGKQGVNDVIDFDDERKNLQFQNDNLAAQLKKKADSIGRLMKEGNKAEAEEAKKEVAEMKEKQKELAERLATTENAIRDILLGMPNIPCDMVPEGRTAEDNVVEKTGGQMPELPADALPHWDLAKKYDLINFDLGVKITGPGFPVYVGKGAKLQRALIQFFLDRASEAGYLEIQPPYVVNEASGYGTGQLPDKEGQMYFINEDKLYLIPTAEVPVTNLYRDVIIPADKLPIKNCAYSACFRREAGSYGKDVRGLNRLHQFDKVEIVQGLLESLGLPWHILRLCGGDMSFTSSITFDFEVYSAAQGRWLEVSSVSNFETYQANRLKCRYRGEDKKTHLCHTLNGSALALPRIMAAILENNQTPEGIIVPECLRKYTGFDIIN